MYSVVISFTYDAREDLRFTVEAENRTDAITQGLRTLTVSEISEVFSIDVTPLTTKESAEMKCQSCQKSGIKGKELNGWIVCDSCYSLAKSWEAEM